MPDRRVLFADWVGEAVELSSSGGKRIPEYGVLEEVNDWGLVLRHRRNIQWSSTGSSESYDQQDLRNVSEFLPWHTISGIRVLEPEERETHGL
jgi:hypothetical protein